MADSNCLERISGHFIRVRTLDFDSDPLSCFQQNTVGADLDIEFVNLVGHERLSLGMKVYGLPGCGCGGVQFSLRSPEPTARQEILPAIRIEMPQRCEPQDFFRRCGTK